MLNRNVKVWHLVVLLLILVVIGVSTVVMWRPGSSTPEWSPGETLSLPPYTAHVMVVNRKVYDDLIEARRNNDEAALEEAARASGGVYMATWKDTITVVEVDGDFAKLKIARDTLLHGDNTTGWTRMDNPVPVTFLNSN
ncbi:MAG: hypothetical protein ACLFWL_17435 [Candidatus Brocadiia bacterium]